MNDCRTSWRARVRHRRNRSAALTRLTGVAIALMAAMVWPMTVFAADPAVDRQDNAGVVFTVIVLLFGSMAAGLFFASPLRRRFSPASEVESVTEAPDAGTFGSEHEVHTRAQHLFEAPEQPTSPALQAAPASEPTPERPLSVAPTAAQHRTVATPLSTARPQPDANWNPERRRAP